MNNNGTFKVLKRADEFVISYIEKGEITYLDLYSFDRYPDAEEYRENHMKELDTYVSDMKEEQKRIEEERLEAERKAEEAPGNGAGQR